MKAHKMKRWGFSLKAFSLLKRASLVSNTLNNHKYINLSRDLPTLIFACYALNLSFRLELDSIVYALLR